MVFRIQRAQQYTCYLSAITLSPQRLLQIIFVLSATVIMKLLSSQLCC
jgi:hypothetical protein